MDGCLYFILSFTFTFLHIAQLITYFARGHSLSEGMKGLEGLPFKICCPRRRIFFRLCIYDLVGYRHFNVFRCVNGYDKYKTNHKEKKWLSYI